MKKSPTKRQVKKEASQADVDSFLQQNFYNSFFSLYNPKHSNFQVQQLNATVKSEKEEPNGFGSPLASYLIKEDVNKYKKIRKETFEEFHQVYPKICQEIVDPNNDISIGFVQKY